MAFPIDPVNCAHFDGNQIASDMGVIGTLGTADTKGTALTLPKSIDPLTGAQYVKDLTGGKPARNILSFSTTIAFSGSAFATLIGSAVVGAGTSLWVNDVSIVNNGGTQKYGIVFGSAINGSAVLAKGQFGPQGGIQKSFPLPVNCGMTNFDLNAWAEGAGTADFSVSYFISA